MGEDAKGAGYTKKSARHLLATPAVKYQFIEDHRQESPVSLLCEPLDVSVSGYYAWRERPMSEHKREDGQLGERIQAAYDANRGVYASPGVHAELQAQGIKCARKRVARLMRELGLAVRRPRHRTITTRSDPSARVAPNCLDRDFTATCPNEKWTGDITAIWTYEGWLYLAAVLDLFFRRVVGWAMAASQDETLVEMAFPMASLQRRPQAGLLHHSDRGCQSTSNAYQVLLAEIGVTVSMSRKGTCWDHAVTESFFGTLKGECVEGAVFSTRAQARQTVFEYRECFYNRVRRHSSLGYVSPVAFEPLKRSSPCSGPPQKWLNLKTANRTKHFEREWRGLHRLVPGIKIAWEQGQVLFQEALTHAMSDEEELGYLSEIDVAVDCFASVSALNTYPQNQVLQAWLINGYMLAWRRHFLKDQKEEELTEGG